jgi:type II protein arginine methyltransferase
MSTSKQRTLSESALAALAAKAQGSGPKLAALAELALAHGHESEAYRIARDARSAAPADPEVWSRTHRALSVTVPKWHFRIVRDDLRNSAYDDALRRGVKPGMRVLDIGSGTGLLAMMAARAGAEEVVSCEMNPAIAEAAAEIVSRNGYSNRVKVVPRRSDALEAADIGGGADLLVSEIISNNMLGQNVLAVMEDAASRLLKPGARMIPASGRVRVALANWAALDERLPRRAAGFDLQPFARFEPVPHYLKSGDAGLRLCSDSVDLFSFDFESGGPFASGRAFKEVKVGDWPANGIVQWIHLQMDPETEYENRPGPGASSCWACLFYPVHPSLDLSPGRGIRLCGAHDRLTLRVWAEDAAAAPPE